MTDYNMDRMGLSSAEAEELQKRYGRNELVRQKKENLAKKVLHIIGEPMFLLLLAAAVIYFLLGKPGDGAVMLIFVIGVISIDVIQEWKTDKTLHALKDLSAPHITVIRDGKETVIASIGLVPGDLMLIYEGVKIPADGLVVKCNNLCIDESSLTGETGGVWKSAAWNAQKKEEIWRKDYCYAGTMVMQGTAAVLVDKIGADTEYGKIASGIATAPNEDTPLQKQTDSLVKVCAGVAGILCVLAGAVTYCNLADHAFVPRIIESILSGITLTMAMIPEEFPVILTVFLSMGAWRLAKKHSLVRKLPSVETLGAVSVLCVDKTGTVTRNQMTVQEVWAWGGDTDSLIETMGLGCEPNAYDPMEQAMLTCCADYGFSKQSLFSGELIAEYAFTNEQKMMGHVWRRNGEIRIAAKGSPERILTICKNVDRERELVENKIAEMSRQGLRVIAAAVGKPASDADIPKEITECSLTFLGLIGLSDPPRENVKNDIAMCSRAGIRVAMITGDHGMTAASIAGKIEMPHCEEVITGDMLNAMSDTELREKVWNVNIFSRVVPEHKMRIVKALKENGEIVAMTGDGVNDAPALKYADIGIAMGKRGCETAREAADFILLDDNFTTIVETVKDGRRIYDNIRKAVGYVFTIHIPIAFASILAPLLGITPEAIFLLPIHIVLLELMIDPTCSIVLERQPAEADIMERKPRDAKENLLDVHLFLKSMIQGLVIFAASFCTYFSMLDGKAENAPAARAMGLVILMLSNLLLVQVNSSSYDFAFRSVRRLIKDKVMWAVNIFTLLGIFIVLYTPVNHLLKFEPLTCTQLLLSAGIAGAAVLWYEFVKLIRLARKSIRRKL